MRGRVWTENSSATSSDVFHVSNVELIHVEGEKAAEKETTGTADEKARVCPLNGALAATAWLGSQPGSRDMGHTQWPHVSPIFTCARKYT